MHKHTRNFASSILSIIGAFTLTIISIPIGFYLLVYLLARHKGKLPPQLQSFIDKYYYPTYLSPEHVQRVPNIVASLGSDTRILNIGGGIAGLRSKRREY